jgi:UDP-N-acetylglucosamine:LPS N-acetylglucosamine transferase
VTRVLILTASVGEGHDLPARVLAGALREREADVDVVDGLAAIGGPMARVAGGGQRLMSYRGRVALDAQYALFGRFGPGRAFARRAMARLARPGLAAVVRERRPDTIVTTYPGFNEALARMRLRGALDAPVVSAITDLSSLWFWAAPGIDLHLITHPESEAEVRRIAPDSRVLAVNGLTRPEFLHPPSRAEARAALDLDERAPVVVVSGGGWGVGDVHGAVATALERPGAHVLVLCGRNEALRASIDPRARAFGFTDRMAEILSAGDCLVHASAGLTVLEALMCGCRPISYGWGVAHIRLNNRAFAEHGLADVVGSRRELGAAIERALARPAEPDRSFAALPAAADEVLRATAKPA